jgi:N-acetylglucosaminyldiphosphoundecaprenol N-acetyl-beta-D-mannosaminyltransferase
MVLGASGKRVGNRMMVPVCDSARVDILGVPVSAISLDEATTIIERWIKDGVKRYVCVTGAHGVMESRRDEKLRSIFANAGLVTPDGMPLVWLARLFGETRTTRVYGPDLMRLMTSISSQRGYRQFYYGGGEGLAERLRQVLVNTDPRLQCVGTICPPFRELTNEEDQAIIDQINAAKPDIVWVGLSTPKQELWMAAHREAIDAPVLIGVGAAFDFLAGVKRQAPLWMQRSGLEWAFRLCTEPRRLWRRYAYIVPGFLILAVGLMAARAFRLQFR